MARALYNRDTLAFIRGRTLAGKGVHAIALEIEWSAEELRRVAARHSIPVIEDEAPKPAEVAAVASEPASAPARDADRKPEPARPRAIPATRIRADARQPALPPRVLLKRDCTGFVRSQSVTLLLTPQAAEIATKIGGATGYKRGAVLSIALDHLCRAGRLRELFDEAMAGAK